MDTVIRELLPQQQPRTIERRDLQYITISKEELTSSDSLSPDPWKRDAREKAEKQQQLHIVDLLDKEIQELQVGLSSVPFISPQEGLNADSVVDLQTAGAARSSSECALCSRRSRSERRRKATASGS